MRCDSHEKQTAAMHCTANTSQGCCIVSLISMQPYKSGLSHCVIDQHATHLISGFWSLELLLSLQRGTV